MQIRKAVIATALVWLVALMTHTGAQQAPPPAAPAGAPQAPAPAGPPAGRGQAPGQGRGGGRATFPAQQRSLADAATIARGKTLYEINCRACHGGDLRGGDIGGPNLLRSQLVLNDQHGELIVPVVKNGRQNPGMPPMPALPLGEEDVKAIAEFIHSVAFTMRGQGSPPPGEEVELNIVVGDAKAGEAYFAAKCASCHSAIGRSERRRRAHREPAAAAEHLDHRWRRPRPRRRRRARCPVRSRFRSPCRTARRSKAASFASTTSTSSSGSRTGRTRTIRRSGDTPKVTIDDPLEGHRKLLTVYTDKDIHDVTAYLVTLK